MQPSGGVDENHVHVPGLGGLNAVKHHRGRVRPLVLADNGRAASARPDLQLIGGRRPEGISRHQHDLLSLRGQLLCDLADGGGLAHAVDADDQNHAGVGGQIQLRVPHGKHIHQNFLQRFPGFLRGFQVLLPDGLAQPPHSLYGGVHTQVCQNQAFLQLIVKIVVNFGKAGEHAAQSAAERFPGLGQSGLDLVKKAHKNLLFIPRFPNILPSGLSPAAAACSRPAPAWSRRKARRRLPWCPGGG